MNTNLDTFPTQESTHDVSTSAMVFDPAIIAGMQRMAEMMCEARVTIPKHLQGSPADCLAIIMQAAQFQINPFAMAQKTFLVGGVLGYEAQLVNAVIANSGAIRGRFHYEYRGDGANIECRVGAIPSGENAVVWGEWLSAASVTTKNSPLWKTNPKQQLGYLQVKNWARQYAPGAILGVYTVDELQDMPIERDMGQAQVVNPPAASRTEAIKAKLKIHTAPPVEVISDLDRVLALISEASNNEQLGIAATEAGKLTDANDKRKARAAYKAKIDAMRAEDEAEAQAEREAIQEETNA